MNDEIENACDDLKNCLIDLSENEDEESHERAIDAMRNIQRVMQKIFDEQITH